MNNKLLNVRDEQITSGINNFTLNGTVCHKIGSIFPVDENQPKFAQLYIYDPDFQLNKRQELFNGLDLNKNSLLENLQKVLDDCNPYAKLYRNALERKCSNPSVQLNIVLRYDKKINDKTYSLPTSDELAAIIVGNDEDRPEEAQNRDIVVYDKSNKIINLSEIHS